MWLDKAHGTNFEAYEKKRAKYQELVEQSKNRTGTLAVNQQRSADEALQTTHSVKS